MSILRTLWVGLLVAGIAAAGAARAQAVNGFYVSGAAQMQWVSDVDFDLPGALNTVHPTSFDAGWGGVLAFGKGFGGPRVEVELGQRTSDVDSFGSAGSVGPGKGDLKLGTAMINGFYDFDTGSRFTPYLGAGIGLARVEATGISRDISTCCTGYVSGDDEVLGWQLIAGVAFQLTSRLALTVDYRYLGTADATLGYGTGCTTSGTSCLVNGKLEQNFSAQLLSLGLRWVF